MKIKLSFFKFFPAIVFSVVFLTSHSTVLAANNNRTIVSGTVSENGVLVEAADVTAVCEGIIMSTNTDTIGRYTLIYRDDACDEGSKVTVTAEKSAFIGSGSGIVTHDHYDTYGNPVVTLDIDMVVINIPSVPEFGLVPGAVALFASSGTFLLLKKRG